jgi:hypothetical protein
MMTPTTAFGRIAAASAFFAVSAILPAQAEMAAPTGEVVLTVGGAIAESNSPEGASFDMEMLMALPKSGFDTTTTWTEGPHRFEGVPLKAVLDAVGGTGATITATALNNYSVEIPLDVIEDEVPIIAYHIDGEPFSRRDKGPLWIVFPYDAGEKYQTELVYGWSIWQLAGLTVSE